MGRLREKNAREGQKIPAARIEIADGSMILPSTCVSWSLYLEKWPATVLFVNKTQPQFSRDFISKCSLTLQLFKTKQCMNKKEPHSKKVLGLN